VGVSRGQPACDLLTPCGAESLHSKGIHGTGRSGSERLGAQNDGSIPDFFPVLVNGQRIGKVTSACYSPRLDKNIGYAMVPVEYGETGAELTIAHPEGTRPGRGGGPSLHQAGVWRSSICPAPAREPERYAPVA